MLELPTLVEKGRKRRSHLLCQKPCGGIGVGCCVKLVRADLHGAARRRSASARGLRKLAASRASCVGAKLNERDTCVSHAAVPLTVYFAERHVLRRNPTTIAAARHIIRAETGPASSFGQFLSR